MKYINLFDTQAAYDEAQKYYPNVSYIVATDEVVYQENDPGPDYSKEYLTFEALQNGTFTLTVPAAADSTKMTSVSYSTDNGTNWTTTAIDNTAQTITTPTIAQGDKVLWKGEGSTLYGSTFSSTGNLNVMGNIMSMLYGDNYANQTTFPNGSEGTFSNLFKNATHLINAENLVLPATTMTRVCYGEMFNGCTSLTTAPELPAITLFYGCYTNMFTGCTSLTTAPELPATTLAKSCYELMFQGCISLTTAPELSATTLTSNCYKQMFQNCNSLNSIKMLATNISGINYLTNWVQGVAATGTFTKDASMSTLPSGDSGIPSGWTVVDIN